MLCILNEVKKSDLFPQEEQRRERKENIMMVMSFDELTKLPPLTTEEIEIIENARPLPTDDCPEMSDEELRQFRPWYDREKQSITLDIDVDILNYFKRLSFETGVSYQELMKMFLMQCAREEMKPAFA